MFTRRRVIQAFGAGLLSAPSASFAQPQGKVWRVGFLAHQHVNFSDNDDFYGPFRQGMRELGYVENKNLLIEWRSAEGNTQRLPELAAELVRLKVDVLITPGTPAAHAAQKATRAIPIVMSGGDPVDSGLVISLARPGGNITGFSTMSSYIYPKLLEILRTIVPKVTSVAILVNPLNAASMLGLRNLQVAAQKLGITILPVETSTPQEIPGAFAMIARRRAGALIVSRDSFLIQHSREIGELAIKQKLPSIGAYSEYTEVGGLMNYGQNVRENYRRVAIYVDKIFKGTNPGDIPVEQPTVFDLIVNMKTAKALGIKIPNSFLVQATRVIE